MNVRADKLRSDFPGLSDEEIAREFARQTECHVVVLYEDRGGLAFKPLRYDRELIEVQSNPYLSNVTVVYDDNQLESSEEASKRAVARAREVFGGKPISNVETEKTTFRRLRSPSQLAFSYLLWLLGAYLVCAILGQISAGFIFSLAGQGSLLAPEDQSRLLISGQIIGFGLWVFVGWWYGGKRLDRYYLFTDRKEVLNQLVLIAVVLWAVVALATFPRILTEMRRANANYSIAIPGYVLSLLIWPAAWYILGWICLSRGWYRESVQLLNDGEVVEATELISEVDTQTSLLQEKDESLLKEVRAKLSAT